MSDENKRDELSRLYEVGAKEEPTAELDATILNAARESVKSTSGRYPFSGGWRVPASLAAVLLVGLAVILQLQQQGEEVLMPGEMLPQEEGLDAIENDTKLKTDDTLGDRETRSSTLKQEVFEAEEQSIRLKAKRADEQPARDNLPQAKDLAAPQESRLQPAPAATEQPADMKELHRRESKIQSRDVLKPQKAGKAEAAVAAEPVLSADAWYQYIEQLVDQGQIDAARTQLQDFRSAYPDYAVDDLLKRIDEG